MKPRILVFTDWFLPGYKAGGPVTSITNVIETFKDEYDFYVLTRNNDYGERKPYDDLRSDEWIKMKEGVNMMYLSPGKLNRNSLYRILRSVDCPVIYISGIYSWYFSILPVLLSRKLKNKRVIVSPRGMLSDHAIRIKSIKKELYLKAAYLFNIYKHVVFQATNSLEMPDIRKYFKGNEIILAPNLPRPLAEGSIHNIKKNNVSVLLVSIARIAAEKNILGALQFILKWSQSNFYRSEYMMEYNLYGQVYSSEYWKRCQEVICQLPENIIVRHLGGIAPEQVPGILKQHHFLFLPSFGENYGHSIIESLGQGRPVIISDRTPWRDLSARDAGWDLALDSDDEFVRVLTDCITMDQVRFNKKCHAALMLAKETFENSDAINAHKRIFEG